MSKGLVCGLSAALATVLLIIGVVIGSIGAANYAKYAPFINNAKQSTCTLQSSLFTMNRCQKWGNCLTVNWNATYPSLVRPSTTSAATVIDKWNLGYWDAAKIRAQRSVGQKVPCLIDSRTGNAGYFKKPAQGDLAMLIIGWVFVLIGTLLWVLFGMVICCEVKFRCSCDCSSSKPTRPTGNPLYSSPTYQYNNSTTTTNKRYSGSDSSRRSIDDAELTPIPPVAVVDTTGPAAGVGRTASVSSSASGSGSGSGVDTGAGAGGGDDYMGYEQ